ncbi:MAG: transposase, partial [Rubripirellula sp.]
WLPGDARGWVDFQRGWKLPSPQLETECESRMAEDAIRLSVSQRRAVEDQIKETCKHRVWHLHAVNCRSNHVHVVVSAPETTPKKIRVDLKSYATRCLKSLDPSRDNWWAERGSIRWVQNEDDLESVTLYVNERQNR